MSAIPGRGGTGLIDRMGRLFGRGSVTGLSEKQLLDRFIVDRDETAFEALVERHGPMVLAVCRQLLRDPHDVDDAFQATFMVLLRRAASLRQADLLGNWLYGVAYRVALKARSADYQRRKRFALASDPAGLSTTAQAVATADSASEALMKAEEQPMLHQEINLLPSKYRAPIVMCYLEGLTHDEAALKLGWPVGTVKGRLARARELLRSRLDRRGLGASSALLLTPLFNAVPRVLVPPALVHSTLRTARAILSAAGEPLTTASAVSPTISLLTEGVVQAMIASHLKSLALAGLVAAGVIATSGTVVAYQFAEKRPESNTPPALAVALQEPAKAQTKAYVGVSNTAEKQAEPAAGQPVAATPGAAPAQATPENQPAINPPAGQPGMGMMGGMGGQRFGGLSAQEWLKNLQDVTGIDTERIGIARLSIQIALVDKNPSNVELSSLLDQKITLAYPQNTPLEEVLKQIRAEVKTPSGKAIPLYVDPIGLMEADKTLTSPVVINLTEIPLRTSLRLILKQLGLAYCMRDGVLIISSVEGVYQELMEIRAEQAVLHPEAFPDQGGRMGGMSGMGGGFR
jgi:RNA polymerase sigma factor (sigma-70 family)